MGQRASVPEPLEPGSIVVWCGRRGVVQSGIVPGLPNELRVWTAVGEVPAPRHDLRLIASPVDAVVGGERFLQLPVDLWVLVMRHLGNADRCALGLAHRCFLPALHSDALWRSQMVPRDGLSCWQTLQLERFALPCVGAPVVHPTDERPYKWHNFKVSRACVRAVALTGVLVCTF